MSDADDDLEQDEEANEAPKASGAPCLLRDRYLVRANKPLPEFSTNYAEAFVAEDKRESSRSLFALVCRSDVPTRTDVMKAMKGIQSSAIIHMVEWGSMNWEPANRNCMTVIYERPAGKRVMNDYKGEIRRIEEFDIGRKVVEPMLTLVKELVNRGISHRAVRPTNMFYLDEAGERLALGDCVAAPAGLEQPLVFEPIESAMCLPVARGAGTYVDDLYALGVSLMFMLLGRNPVAHMDDETILRKKLLQGTYNALVGETRLSLPTIELLRGLLCDVSEQRWGIEALEMWLEGRRLSPLQPRGGKRAARGYPFADREYYSCRDLAMAMAKNWEAAIPHVVDGKLELWLRRSLEDKELADAVAEVVLVSIAGSGDKRGALDGMLCKVLMLMDSSAPIRYKGFNAQPEGIGAAVAVVMAKSGDTRLLTEVILREVPKMWFEARKVYHPDNTVMEGRFREVKNYLAQIPMGFGLERCLYEMNESLPCQSALVGGEFVVELRDLLSALNAVAATHKKISKQIPIDRHVAAFMGARSRNDIDRYLTQCSDTNPANAALALLSLFAEIQARHGPEQLPALANWLASLCQPAVEVYYSRPKRKELEKEIPRLAQKGSITELFSLLDNHDALKRDQNEFAWAQAQYQAAEEEIRNIEVDAEDRAKESRRAGKQVAAIVGIFIGLVTATITVIVNVW